MWKQHSYIVFLFCFFQIYGQQKEITGIIKNIEDDPVPFANVIVNDTIENSQPITYDFSDNQGKFSIEIPKNLTNLVIEITAIGYEKKQVSILTYTEEPIVIYLDESITALKEVVVKARKLTDTLNIDTEGMNLSKENTLRDVLNKTDGVIVGEEGGISFQGKQINKILINGKEVFVNQNKVALDNLNHEIMENVQIINNYKDKFTIDFNRIRDPVINIETKSEFTGILKAQLDVGYGYKDKYGVNAKGFFFSNKLNAFATSNTNNTGDKELSQKDVSASLPKNATSALSNVLFPFFVEDYRTNKNFVSNSSLTLRFQGDNSKTGLVIYHGNIHTKRKTDLSTFIADTLVKQSREKNTNKGNFISSTLNHSRILSSKAVLQNVMSVMAIDQRQNRASIDTLFVPRTTYLEEGTNEDPTNVTFTNDLKVTLLTSDNKALNLGLNYYHENNDINFDTQLKNGSSNTILQHRESTKNYISAYGNLAFKFKKAALNTGITLTKNMEKGTHGYINSPIKNSGLKRDVTTLEMPLSLNGSIKKMDYDLSITPTLIHTETSKNHGFLKMDHQLTYNFEAQNNLSLEYSRDYNFYDLNSLYDTIVRTYNHRIINDKSNIDQYAIQDEVSLGWYNSNVARSKNMHIAYRYHREQDFLQSVLDSISNNVFYYSNRIFDKKNTHNLNIGWKKGIYVGSSYNRLDVGGTLGYTASEYSTIFNSKSARSSSNSWEPTFNLGFMPRKSFIKEINNTVEWNHLTFAIDGNEVTQQSIITNTFMVRGHGNKVNWKIDFEYKFYDINQDKFSVPDSNISFKYELSDKISITLVGRSILTLLDLNNYNFVNTISDGNTLMQSKTDNNLGYLMLYTSFEF